MGDDINVCATCSGSCPLPFGPAVPSPSCTMSVVMNCCWPCVTLRFGGSDRIQLTMSSSSCMVNSTICLYQNPKQIRSCFLKSVSFLVTDDVAPLQSPRALHCLLLRLVRNSFSTTDTSNTMGSAGSYGYSYHSLDLLLSGPPSKLAAFCVTQYMGWSSISRCEICCLQNPRRPPLCPCASFLMREWGLQ